MPDMRHISKPHTRPLLVVLLFLLVFSAALMLVLPQAKALADTGPTMLSINIKNSSIYTITLDNDGVEPNQTFDVVYDAYLGSVTPPKQRDGYSFLGYFDSANKMYFDTEGKGLGKWDKTSDTTLYAHWALQIQCTFPSKALVRVDAAGNITGQEGLPFSSTSAGAIKITAVESSQDSGADSLFVGVATLRGTRILLTPPAASGSTVEVPLTTATTTTTIPGEGWTIAAGTIDNPSTLLVDFSLSLPDGAQLNYLAGDGEVSVANLSYVVSAA